MAGRIYFTSDCHFNHSKAFCYEPRGFSSAEEMNEAIIRNWNSVVDNDDDVYMLGDFMLGDNEKGKECIARLNGRIHVILGNHDSAARERIYVEELDNIVEVKYATIIKYGKCRFYLSHYPTMTSNYDDAHFNQRLFNLYGHTHQKTNFYNDMFCIYHVGVDSHNCTPVLIDDIINEMREKYLEGKIV